MFRSSGRSYFEHTQAHRLVTVPDFFVVTLSLGLVLLPMYQVTVTEKL